MLRKLLSYSMGSLALISLISCSPVELQVYPTETLVNSDDAMIAPTATETYPDDVLRILNMSADMCDPPCWMGIVPYQTTYEEALEIVNELYFFADSGTCEFDENRTYIFWYSGAGQNAVIRFKNGLATLIKFYISEAALGDVVQTYGPPEYYTTLEGDDGYGIDVFYPQAGLVFFVGPSISESPSETMSANHASFILPDEMDGFLANYINLLESTRPRFSYGNDEYFPWEGYGICPQGLIYYSCEE